MGQRSRKRGQRDRPSATRTPVAAEPMAKAATAPVPKAAAEPKASFAEVYRARSESKNAEARAGLEPLTRGERPWPLRVAIALTALAGGSQLILYILGFKVDHKPLPPSSLLLFVVMLACAVGMWRLWYQAVLAFMVLLAIIVCLFALLLVEASNILGLLVGLAVVGGGGFLFWKLVRVLGRLQMPARPTR